MGKFFLAESIEWNTANAGQRQARSFFLGPLAQFNLFSFFFFLFHFWPRIVQHENISSTTMMMSHESGSFHLTRANNPSACLCVFLSFSLTYLLHSRATREKKH